METKKINEISYFEVVLCLAVIMIHILSESVTGYVKGSFLSGAAFFLSRSLTFVVPAFIMSSGIKLFGKYKDGGFEFLPFIKKRITKIYLPFLLCVAVYYFYFVFRLHYFPFDFRELLSYLALGNIAAPFYFVIVIMQFYITFPLWLWLFKRTKPIYIIPVAAAVSVISIYFLRGFEYLDKVSACYSVYWCIGGFIGLDYERFSRLAARYRPIIVTLGVGFTLIYTSMAYVEFMGMSAVLFRTEIVKMLFSIFVSVMYLSIMPKEPSKKIGKISALTYHVYLIHCLLIFEINHDMTVCKIGSVSARLAIRGILVYTLSFGLCYVWNRLKNALNVKKM